MNISNKQKQQLRGVVKRTLISIKEGFISDARKISEELRKEAVQYMKIRVKRKDGRRVFMLSREKFLVMMYTTALSQSFLYAWIKKEKPLQAFENILAVAKFLKYNVTVTKHEIEDAE
jgi:hypothetical protein